MAVLRIDGLGGGLTGCKCGQRAWSLSRMPTQSLGSCSFLGQAVEPSAAWRIGFSTRAFKRAVQCQLPPPPPTNSTGRLGEARLYQSEPLIAPEQHQQLWYSKLYRGRLAHVRPRLLPQIDDTRLEDQVSRKADVLQSHNLQLGARESKVVLGAIVVIGLAVLNRILFKMALISMRQHPLILAQFTTIGYVGIYASIAAVRFRQGIVTQDMLRHPKRDFVVIGAFEALGAMIAAVSAGKFPGVLIPILAQGFLVWQLAFSALFLRKRYSIRQFVGVGVLLAGIALVVLSGKSPGGVAQTNPIYPLAYLGSLGLAACASIIKEMIFKNAKKHVKGGNMDVFVVNGFGSGFQAIFVALLLPVVLQFNRVPFGQLSGMVSSGAGCFLGVDKVQACPGAPWIPLAYIASNVCYNVAVIALLKMSSAIVPSLALTLSVPLTVLAFTVPLPLLGSPATLSPSFFSGTCIILGGLLLYMTSPIKPTPNCPAPRKYVPNRGHEGSIQPPVVLS